MKRKVKEAKEKPHSKRKAFLLGFTLPLIMVAITFFDPAFSALAKDLPEGTSHPTGIAPAQAVPPTSKS